MKKTLLICVFSFNRGRFLEHCIETIELCAPMADIAVFDDESYDLATQRSLDRLSDKHSVISRASTSKHKLGGLYGNMQAALEYAADYPLVVFLQDDMQMVRPLVPDEILVWQQCFEQKPQQAFLQPCFLKGVNRGRDLATLVYDHSTGLYLRSDTGQSAGRFFSAVHITQPSRLLAAGWAFAGSEPENERQACQHFGQLGHLFTPFAMWLPNVPAYRGKRKTLALRWAEKYRRCGFYPYKILGDSGSNGLKMRDPDVLPFAEDFLQNESPDLVQPWDYYPMQGLNWLKKMSSLELTLRRFLGGRS